MNNELPKTVGKGWDWESMWEMRWAVRLAWLIALLGHTIADYLRGLTP